MFEDLKWDAAGLVTVVAQDRLTGEVRMLAHANAEAVSRTLETGIAWFWSRSRQSLWKKGESSGNVLRVFSVRADCDRDALLYLVDPSGPSCHTGEPSCFFLELSEEVPELHDADERTRAPELLTLTETIEARASADGDTSYTRRLLDGGAEKIGAKIREEGGELAEALASESDERVVSEAADVLYHLMVGLQLRGKTLRDVAGELARRAGVSGLEEKASRSAD